MQPGGGLARQGFGRDVGRRKKSRQRERGGSLLGYTAVAQRLHIMPTIEVCNALTVQYTQPAQV
eukprot:3912854-Prymnesium_polylepis.1